jgi:ubiquinone/menaquinone biosynthesis C-methylase UbiE
VLTERCGVAARVVLQLGNALELPYPDQTFDVVWCQNVTMNIADKAGFLAGVYRVLKARRAAHSDGILGRTGRRYYFPRALGL